MDSNNTNTSNSTNSTNKLTAVAIISISLVCIVAFIFGFMFGKMNTKNNTPNMLQSNQEIAKEELTNTEETTAHSNEPDERKIEAIEAVFAEDTHHVIGTMNTRTQTCEIIGVGDEGRMYYGWRDPITTDEFIKIMESKFIIPLIIAYDFHQHTYILQGYDELEATEGKLYTEIHFYDFTQVEFVKAWCEESRETSDVKTYYNEFIKDESNVTSGRRPIQVRVVFKGGKEAIVPGNMFTLKSFSEIGITTFLSGKCQQFDTLEDYFNASDTENSNVMMIE